MARPIGIDLGTTNSVISYVEQNRVETIPTPQGSRLTPSVIIVQEEGNVIVGELAKRQMATNPGMAVRSAKRLMGRRFTEIQDIIEDFPYQIVPGENDRAEIRLENGSVYPPEQISAYILAALRDIAEDYLDEEVDSAVITVPAYFNDSQRVATKRAAELAGLKPLRILNEPTSAALAYGLGGETNKIVAIFDFGGGTFDISILQLQGDVFEVLATNGDTQLGGDDLDLRFFSEIRDEIIQQTGIDPALDPKSVQRIHEAAEKAKCELSSLTATSISLPFIVADKEGPKHYEREVTREEFSTWMRPYFDRLLDPCRKALKDANLSAEQIETVLLVGGSTRIPRVREIVEQFFRKSPDTSINPDEAVAMGAAIQAGVMKGELEEVLLLDVCPLSLGIELAGGVFKPIIPRNSSIPCEATHKFTTVVDNQTNVLVHILQGERAKADENRTLARFRLTDIPPMPKELPEVEVRFLVDANGILEVSAVELTSGISTGVVIEGYGQLMAPTAEEVRNILEEVEIHHQEDEEFIRYSKVRANAHRVQSRVNRLLEHYSELVKDEDVKAFKEMSIRLDMFMLGKEWDRAESIIEELISKLEDYEGYEEVHAFLNQELDVPALPEAPPGQAASETDQPQTILPPPREDSQSDIHEENTPVRTQPAIETEPNGEEYAPPVYPGTTPDLEHEKTPVFPWDKSPESENQDLDQPPPQTPSDSPAPPQPEPQRSRYPFLPKGRNTPQPPPEPESEPEPEQRIPQRKSTHKIIRPQRSKPKKSPEEEQNPENLPPPPPPPKE